MFNRISNVSSVDIISLDHTSILQIGDSEQLKPCANVIAIQREKGVFWEDELHFRDFPLFQEKIPEPYTGEQVIMKQVNENPFIQVKDVQVHFIAASSSVHIGSTQVIQAKAKVLNIRHLIKKASSKHF